MRFNSYQDFFIKNYLKFANELYKKGDLKLKEILTLQDKNSKEFLNQIANIMLKYNIKEDRMSLNLKEQIYLNKELDDYIEALFKSEYKKENIITSDILLNIAKEKYHINNFLLSFSINFKLKKISDEKLKKILDRKIDNKNYSKRIWGNKNDISKKIKVDIREFLNGNISCNKIEKELRYKFSVDKFYSKRLINNEISRVQNEVNEQFFKDHNGEYLLYSATLDKHTCEKCKKYDGKVYKIDEERPQLPQHIGDRCTYILIPRENYRPISRYNNITKENINYKDYERWAKENNL